MSNHEYELILSPLAEEDFADILQYTFETWNKSQVLIYRSILDKALTTIKKNPGIGTLKPELSHKHRIFLAGQHIVIYYYTENTVMISRILHKRMDYTQHLD